MFWYKFYIFFNLVQKTSLIVKILLSVAKKASLVYEWAQPYMETNVPLLARNWRCFIYFFFDKLNNLCLLKTRGSLPLRCNSSTLIANEFVYIKTDETDDTYTNELKNTKDRQSETTSVSSTIWRQKTSQRVLWS